MTAKQGGRTSQAGLPRTGRNPTQLAGRPPPDLPRSGLRLHACAPCHPVARDHLPLCFQNPLVVLLNSAACMSANSDVPLGGQLGKNEQAARGKSPLQPRKRAPFSAQLAARPLCATATGCTVSSSLSSCPHLVPLVKSTSSGGRLSVTLLLGSPVMKCFSLAQNYLSFQDPGKPTSPMKSALTPPVHTEDPLSQPQSCTQAFCCLMYP